MKKFLCCVLVLFLFLSVVGCSSSKNTVKETEKELNQQTNNENNQELKEEKVVLSKNPFTGEEEITKENENMRPVAVVINNISIAQKVQTGVQNADIIYETEVEGGITRLLAVFKDISKVEQIGTVRSARSVFIDLAMGHDALLVHCGIDPIYAEPYSHSVNIDNFNINSNPYAKYGFREKNGLSSEHTVYTSAEKLKEGFENLKTRTTTEKRSTFCDFFEKDEQKVPGEGQAIGVTVRFSSAATSVFTYNEETKKYTKNTKGIQNKDLKSGESYEITNVFVLNTPIYDYDDGYHRNVSLNSGTGYYISNGGYKKIIWKKEAYNKPIKYYNTDNTPLKINVGKSWICITNTSNEPIFEPAE